MARGKAHSAEFKRKVVSLYLSGAEKRAQLADRFGVGISTVDLWIAAHRDSVREEAAGIYYTIDGKRFTTIEDCRQYAVDKLGGIFKVVTTKLN